MYGEAVVEVKVPRSQGASTRISRRTHALGYEDEGGYLRFLVHGWTRLNENDVLLLPDGGGRALAFR